MSVYGPAFFYVKKICEKNVNFEKNYGHKKII